MNKTNKETELIKEQKAYVKRYAKQRGITVKQALEHEIVKNVIKDSTTSSRIKFPPNSQLKFVFTLFKIINENIVVILIFKI